MWGRWFPRLSVCLHNLQQQSTKHPNWFLRTLASFSSLMSLAPNSSFSIDANGRDSLFLLSSPLSFHIVAFQERTSNWIEVPLTGSKSVPAKIPFGWRMKYNSWSKKRILRQKNLVRKSLIYLEHKVVLSLELKVQDCFPNHSFKVQVSPPGDIQSRKEVTNQTHEHGHVICYNLGDVEISQGAHQHLVLWSVRVSSFQGACYHKDRLDGPQSPVIVILGEDSTVEARVAWMWSIICMGHTITQSTCYRSHWSSGGGWVNRSLKTMFLIWHCLYFSSNDSKADKEHPMGWGSGE